MSNAVWNDNSIQFPRMLAEILAVGLTHEQMQGLVASMDLDSFDEVDEILERAECEFMSIKGDHSFCPYTDEVWHERTRR